MTRMDQFGKVWVIDDFLPSETFTSLANTVLAHDFPWYYADAINGPDVQDEQEYLTNFQFVHIIHDDHRFMSHHAHLLEPVFEKLNLLALIRVKFNLNPVWRENALSGFHKDLGLPALSGILYLNDSDGLTVFQNGRSVEPKENRFLIFDSRLMHSASKPQKCKRRVILNLIWIPRGEISSPTFKPLGLPELMSTSKLAPTTTVPYSVSQQPPDPGFE